MIQENQLKQYFYLVPVVGILPALWTLYSQSGTKEDKQISRLAIALAFIWVMLYISLGTSAQMIDLWGEKSETLGLRLLFINGLMTSGYFLCTLFLMFRLWKRQTVRLPGISYLVETIWKK